MSLSGQERFSQMHVGHPWSNLIGHLWNDLIGHLWNDLIG
jgi:hypothetical protein